MFRSDAIEAVYQCEPNRCFYTEDLPGSDDETTTNLIVTQSEIELIRQCPVEPSSNQPRVLYHLAYTNQVLFDKYSPILPDMPRARRHSRLQPAIRWKKFSTRMAISFPVQTIKPKVQLQLIAANGEIPREVEVERRLRRYGGQNILDVFAASNIQMWQLLPYHALRPHLSTAECSDQYSTKFSLFPLEWFDNDDFDCMRPEDWLNLGILNDQRHPIPAMAFLPDRRRSNESNNLLVDERHTSQMGSKSVEDQQAAFRNYLYKWVHVAVQDYDPVQMRWLVVNMDTTRSYKIPRLFLMFLAESPQNFVERIAYALAARKNADRFLRFNLIQNNMRLTGVPTPGDKILRRIFALISSSMAFKRPESTTMLMENLEMEITINYQWAQAGLELERNIRMSPEDLSFIEVPSIEVTKKPRFHDGDCQMKDFENAKDWLRVHTIFCLPQVVTSMDHVIVQCAHVSRMLFYTLSISKTASLDDFNAVQEYATITTLNYIKGFWVENVSGLICMTIRSIGKGWFDISESKWTIYLYAKMYRFLQLIKFHMQTSLRNLVTSSIRMFSKLVCQPCVCMLDVTDDFVWGSDVITSPFMPGTFHVFYLVLHINEEFGPYYSNDPDHYKPMLLELFNNPIQNSHFVHFVDPLVMGKLTYAKDLYLSSVGLIDPLVVEAREYLTHCYTKAVIPLKAYLREYVRHIEFFLLDTKTYLRDFKEADKTPQEYQDEISMQLRMKQNLEVTLPASIQIGPFLINVDPLKVYLITKRAELASKLLDLLTEKLRDETQIIIDEYNDIIKRLSERPISIEQIFATRQWMETLPEVIATFENQMKLKLFEYDILDYFWRALPNDDFKVKWDALAGPLKCTKQMHTTWEMFEEETERFQKIQTSDLVGFDEKVEALNMSVSTFSSLADTSKVAEIAVDIKKLWKLIVETSEMGKTLNVRQALFELPDIDLTGIQNLLVSFAPYRKLWVTGADFTKWEEAWCGNPLVNVAPDAIRVSVDEYKAAIVECIQIFEELPKVQEVAKHFLDCIEQFEPKLDVLGWIKNPAWILVYWQEFGKTTGLEFKYSISINFDYLLDKGIMQHYDTVREISERATQMKDQLEAEMLAAEQAKREAEEELERKKNSRRGRKLK